MTAKRLNTGVIRNGDDWPGIFIRGDETDLLNVIRLAIMELKGEKTVCGVEGVVSMLEDQTTFLKSGRISSRDEQPDGVQVVEYK